MPAPSLQHPTPEDLASFIQGRLAPAPQVAVEQHVAECATCAEYLTTVENDTLVEYLRGGATPAHSSVGEPTVGSFSDVADLPQELQQHSRYRVVRLLGAGGMGVVFLAEHRVMARTVALKVINRGLTRNHLAVERFRQEVRGAAKLSHPNIVAAHDAEQAGDVHFLVMEYVDGVSLAQLIARRGPLPVAHACNYIKQAAQGLQHAWQHGIVHRDIKPANLMLTRTGKIKILDFGLARLAQEQSSDESLSDTRPRAGLTACGSTMGTPDYVAPEQISDARSVSIQADIYSLGATFYYLLTGQPPFPLGTVAEKLVAHRSERPQAANELRPEIPVEVAEIIDRMLAKNPADRFATPADVGAALSPWSKSSSPTISKASVPVITPPPILSSSPPSVAVPPSSSSASRIVRTSDGKKLLAVVGGAAVLVAAIAAFGVRTYWGKDPQDSIGGPTKPVAPVPNAADSRRSPAPAVIAKLPAEPRVLVVIPHDNLWYPDYDQVVRAFQHLGKAKVSVASSSLDTAQPNRTSPGARPIEPDVRLQDVDPKDVDVVIFTGANPPQSMEYLAGHSEHSAAARLVEGVLKHGGRATALCAGNAVLADLGVLKGRNAAANQYALQAMHPGHGANWLDDEAVVSDGPVMTARDAASARLFVEQLLDSLEAGR